MSFPWPGCSCREDAGGIFDQGLIDVCGLGSQRWILTGTVPCALNSVLRGDHCPAVGSAPGASWDLTLTLTLPRTGTLHRNLSLPRSLALQLTAFWHGPSLQHSREITRLQSLRSWRFP